MPLSLNHADTCTCAIAYVSTDCLPNLFSQAMATGAFLQNSAFKFYEDQTVCNISPAVFLSYWLFTCYYFCTFSVAETESYTVNQPTEWTGFEDKTDYHDLS